MIDDLGAAVDALVIPVDPVDVARVVAIKQRFDAKLNAALADLDAAKLWETDGSSSLTAWLRNHGVPRRVAGRQATLARQLSSLPVLRAAWETGALTAAQIDAVLAVLSSRVLPLLMVFEATLVPLLVGLTEVETEEVMREWRRRADAQLDAQPDDDSNDEPEPAGEPSSTLYASAVGGRTAVDGDLDGRIGELLRTALRVSETPDADGLQRSPAERRADALGTVCEFFLDNHAQSNASGYRNRPHVNLVCDVDDMNNLARGGRFINGTWVDEPTLATLLCDATLHRLLFADGVTLDYGTAVRTAPTPLFNALVTRDEHCRFPGCDRPPHWCHAHHNREWRRRNGKTKISNLVLLCSYHHHLPHRKGWAWQLDPDGTFHVTNPQGRTHTTHPPRVMAERVRQLFNNLTSAFAT